MEHTARLSGIFILAGLCAALPRGVRANATSLHLNFSDPPGRLIAMEVSIPYETVGTYYEVFGWFGTGNGYAGLQRTSGVRGNDGRTFTKHLHFSLWDTPDAKPIPMIWKRPEVVVNGFGGEGTGVKSLWPFEWQAGKRYTVVLKTWDSGPEQTAFGTWFRDNASGTWYRTATWGYPKKGVVIEGGNDSFIEDYQGNSTEVRESRIGPGWKRDLKGKWFPMKTCRFNANQDGTQKWDGGVVNGSFMMKTGGNVVPGLARNTLLTIAMADTPSFAPQAPALAAELRNGRILTRWMVDSTLAPAFAYTIEVFAAEEMTGAPWYKNSRVDPGALSDTSDVLSLGAGPFYALLTLTDIFERKSEARAIFGSGTAVRPGVWNPGAGNPGSSVEGIRVDASGRTLKAGTRASRSRWGMKASRR